MSLWSAIFMLIIAWFLLKGIGNAAARAIEARETALMGRKNFIRALKRQARAEERERKRKLLRDKEDHIASDGNLFQQLDDILTSKGGEHGKSKDS